MQPVTIKEAANAVTTLLKFIGEDVNREGLASTPERVISSFEELFSGYNQDPIKDLQTTFKEVGGYDDVIILKDIDLFSYCEHHMLPIIGKANIAYLPDKKIVGISKLARVVNSYSRRLQVQERLTAQIADAINISLNPKGVVVTITAVHYCMIMRGVNKINTSMTTVCSHGIFKDKSREEILRVYG